MAKIPIIFETANLFLYFIFSAFFTSLYFFQTKICHFNSPECLLFTLNTPLCFFSSLPRHNLIMYSNKYHKFCTDFLCKNQAEFDRKAVPLYLW
jgi:hypothetical protein